MMSALYRGYTSASVVFVLQTVLLWLLICILVLTVADGLGVPRTNGSTPVFSGSYMGAMDATYYLTSYVRFVFEDDAQPDKVLYNSSVSKYLFTFKKPRWEYYLPFSAVKLTAVVPLGKEIVAGGVHHAVEQGAAVQRLYIAKLAETITRNPRGMPTGAKIYVVANYTLDTAARAVHVAKITPAGKTVFVCGQIIPSKPFTPTSTNAAEPSASFLYTFDTDLHLLKKSAQTGSARDKCEDTIFAQGKLHVLETKYQASTVVGEYPHHTVITSQYANGTQYWQTILDTPTLYRLAGAQKKKTTGADTDMANIDVGVSRAVVVDMSMFVVVRLYNRHLKTGADVGVVKLSIRSGAILWVKLRLTESIGSRHTEVINSLGITHASDNYVYTVVRLRNVTSAWNEIGMDTGDKSGAAAGFVSYTLRLSIWGDFDPAQDISVPLWKSRSIKGPAVSVVFSKLQGIVKALGLMKDDNNDGGSNAENHPFTALPLGPSVNDNKKKAAPFGILGSQFLRMTFDLEISSSGKHAVISDTLAELMRIEPSRMGLDSAPKPEDDQKKKGGHNHRNGHAHDDDVQGNKSNDTQAGAGHDEANGMMTKKYALLVRDNNLATMEHRVFALMADICTVKDSGGYSRLERATGMPPNSVLLENLTVRSRGVTNAPDSANKERSAADVAEELVRKTTITGVCIAAALVAVVALAVGLAKIRRTVMNFDKHGENDMHINADRDAAHDLHEHGGELGGTNRAGQSFARSGHSSHSRHSFASQASGMAPNHLL